MVLAGLAEEVLATLPRLGWDGPDQAETDGLIARLLTAQRSAIPAIAAFHDASPPGPDAPWWRHAVPTGLFRRQLLIAGGEANAEHVFQSSGTTDPTRRSRAGFTRAGLALMDAAIDASAERMLFPDGPGTTRILVLAPPPALAPAMIMAYGMARLIDRFGVAGSRFLVSDSGLDAAEVVAELTAAIADGTPVTLIGASFGLVHLLDGLAERGAALPLPEGSRVMHAGGFKGRSRTLDKGALHDHVADLLGVPQSRCVNLLGMTELASQFYDDTLAADLDGRQGLGVKVNPPWTRTVVLDPATLDPAPRGELGVLAHLDMANVERPAAIRTRDVGYAVDGGFEILGRVAGADSRGCSLSVEELIR